MAPTVMLRREDVVLRFVNYGRRQRSRRWHERAEGGGGNGGSGGGDDDDEKERRRDEHLEHAAQTLLHADYERAVGVMEIASITDVGVHVQLDHHELLYYGDHELSAEEFAHVREWLSHFEEPTLRVFERTLARERRALGAELAQLHTADDALLRDDDHPAERRLLLLRDVQRQRLRAVRGALRLSGAVCSGDAADDDADGDGGTDETEEDERERAVFSDDDELEGESGSSCDRSSEWHGPTPRRDRGGRGVAGVRSYLHRMLALVGAERVCTEGDDAGGGVLALPWQRPAQPPRSPPRRGKDGSWRRTKRSTHPPAHDSYAGAESPGARPQAFDDGERSVHHEFFL